MGFTVLGFISLLLALIEMSAFQVALLLAVMFAMHKKLRPRLSTATYGTFDFDAFEKGAFTELVIRLVLTYAPVTILLHMSYYVLVGRTRHPFFFGVGLFAIESVLVTCALRTFFKLDTFRLVILSSFSAVVYLALKFFLVGRLLYG